MIDETIMCGRLPHHALVRVTMPCTFHSWNEYRIPYLSLRFHPQLHFSREWRSHKVLKIPHLHTWSVLQIPHSAPNRFSRYQWVCQITQHCVACVVQFRPLLCHVDHQKSKVEICFGSLSYLLRFYVHAKLIQHFQMNTSSKLSLKEKEWLPSQKCRFIMTSRVQHDRRKWWSSPILINCPILPKKMCSPPFCILLLLEITENLGSDP